MEPRYPFNRLAILAHDEEYTATTDSVKARNLEVSDSSSGVAFDSSRSLRPLTSFASSNNSSDAGSVHGPYVHSGSLTGTDSRRSLHPTTSLSSMEGDNSTQTLRGSESLVGQPIAEGVEGPQPIVARGRQSDQPLGVRVPMISDWNDFDAADFGKRGKVSRRTLSENYPKEKQGGLMLKRFSIADPFTHIRKCKKKKNCSKPGQCKWDLFPGIRLLEPPKTKKSNSPPSTPNQQVYEKPRDSQSSPRGPLSAVDSTEFDSTRSTPMEDQLARTFDIQDLVASENSTAESQDNWSYPSQERSQQSKAATAPDIGQRPREPVLPRSVTAPDLGGEGSTAVKDTGKLRVERFKGITFVNEYALILTLGKGSFGKVKLALNTKDHELYGLKLIPKSRRRKRPIQQGSPQFAEADVLQEITVMKELSHPNIVRLVEVIDDPLNSKMLMVLEYVEGGSVFAGTKISPGKRLTELAARKYFRDVLKGLDYLHSHQVAHGDLKPDNLLLGGDGHIKIADFGSSQLTRCCDLVNRTAGTPAFMAPEMCSGQPYHARVADVWALGVCLYMFIFGTVPFKSDSILGLYNEICNTPLTFPPHIFVSNSLKHLLTRLLDKDPESRISLISTMHHHWVTHNGGYPLPNIQGLEADEEEDPLSLLMECWPDDPADIGLESVLKTISPLFEQRLYPAGTLLAKQGEVARCIFFIEEGTVQVYHTRKTAEAADSDAEDDDESADEDVQTQDKRLRLKRQGSMLKTMFCATVRASGLVSAVRGYAGGDSALLATRSRGSFIGEVLVYEKGGEVTWQTCVKALDEVKVLVLYYKDLKDLIAKRPEVESDVRAVMAQRKGELLKMEMLERLAGMYNELRAEVEFSSVGRGASASAIATARELLGCPEAQEHMRKVESGLAGQYACTSKRKLQPPPPEAEGVGVPAKEEKVAESQSPKVEQSRGSFETKGDSAKTLSLFDGGKTGLSAEVSATPCPQ